LKDEPYRIRAVERAVSVLGTLAAADRPRTLTEIAAGAGLSVPTTFRLLRTLQAAGLVMPQSTDGRYALGMRILELAHAVLRQLDIVAVARPFLLAARDRVNETACLAVRSGDYWVPIAVVEGTQPVRRAVSLGEPTPLYVSGTGKVLLAGESDEEVEAYIARTRLVPFSSSTVTDPDILREQVKEARERGHGTSNNEQGEGGAGVSAPVRAHDGRVVAAVLFTVPASRFSDDLRDACLDAVLEAARGISQALGYRQATGVSPNGALAATTRTAPTPT
jgi:DNA-binding IclR family transcriptional regulator